MIHVYAQAVTLRSPALTCMQLMSTPIGRMGSNKLRKREGDTATVQLRVG